MHRDGAGKLILPLEAPPSITPLGGIDNLICYLSIFMVQPFPTLEAALNSVDGHAGFNIELKWDMELADGRRESHNAFELNLFVDTILKTVLEHGNKRKIVFSSFNPGSYLG